MNRNYNIQIEGNEALIEKFIEAIQQGTCKIIEDDPNQYVIPGGETMLNYSIVEYFLNKESFVAARAIQFCEKIRIHHELNIPGHNIILEEWIEERIHKVYYTRASSYTNDYTLKPTADISTVNPEYLKLMCYVAINLIKYGASYESVTANRYFNMVKELGSDEVEELKKNGSGNLSKNITEYKDQQVSCVANDVFATIKIKIKEENEESYRTIFEYLCNLLKSDFPKSYSIEFSGKTKNNLPIKGLPKSGVHYLFANGVQYPRLHPLIATYSILAMKKWEWYNNMEDENCAMPSTFAVFALGLESEEYFGLVIKYMQTVDEGHQSIQEKFTPAFVEKFGINKKSFPVFISCILSMQEHKPFKVFAEQFNNLENLELLLACKKNFLSFISEESKADWNEEDFKTMPDYIWNYVLYSIWGPEEKYPAIIKKSPAALKPFHQELLTVHSEFED